MPVYFFKAKQRYTVGKWKQKEVPVSYTGPFRALIQNMYTVFQIRFTQLRWDWVWLNQKGIVNFLEEDIKKLALPEVSPPVHVFL
jgi:polyferredoxin